MRNVGEVLQTELCWAGRACQGDAVHASGPPYAVWSSTGHRIPCCSRTYARAPATTSELHRAPAAGVTKAGLSVGLLLEEAAAA